MYLELELTGWMFPECTEISPQSIDCTQSYAKQEHMPKSSVKWYLGAIQMIKQTCLVVTSILRIYRQKKGEIGYDGNKKVKGIKLSVITENQGLPVAAIVSPANIHDSKLYIPTIQKFKIKLKVGRPITRPEVINADKAYDSKEIRDYNRIRGIITNVPVNNRNRKNPKVGRPFRLNKEEYARRNAVE